MGMFDTVYIERTDIVENLKKLLKEEVNPDFQTKDLENALLTYRVTDKGLEAEDYLYRKPKKSETYKIGTCTLPFAVKEHKGWYKVNWTTTLNVYSSTEKGKWVDVLLEFYRGKLVSYTFYIRNKKTTKKHYFEIK